MLVQLDGTLSVEEAIREAESDPRVDFAEPNLRLAPAETIPNDALFNSMWALHNPTVTGADIAATRAWDITTGGEVTAGAVVGDRRVDVAIGDHDVPQGQRGRDHPGHVLGAVGREQQGLGAR